MMYTPSPDLLSPKEQEILALITLGLTSAEIAKRLYLSQLTVNTHRRNILRKTGAKNVLTLLAHYRLFPAQKAA